MSGLSRNRRLRGPTGPWTSSPPPPPSHPGPLLFLPTTPPPPPASGPPPFDTHLFPSPSLPQPPATHSTRLLLLRLLLLLLLLLLLPPPTRCPPRPRNPPPALLDPSLHPSTHSPTLHGRDCPPPVFGPTMALGPRGCALHRLGSGSWRGVAPLGKSLTPRRVWVVGDKEGQIQRRRCVDGDGRDRSTERERLSWCRVLSSKYNCELILFGGPQGGMLSPSSWCDRTGPSVLWT